MAETDLIRTPDQRLRVFVSSTLPNWPLSGRQCGTR